MADAYYENGSPIVKRESHESISLAATEIPCFDLLKEPSVLPCIVLCRGLAKVPQDFGISSVDRY